MSYFNSINGLTDIIGNPIRISPIGHMEVNQPYRLVGTSFDGSIDTNFWTATNNGTASASGVAINYTIQSVLSLTTYYWRVRGIDPAGSNTYGAWSSVRSFIITASIGVKTINELAKASIKTLNGLTYSFIKTFNGLQS